MRKMTDAEYSHFDGCEDHRNTGHDHHCCPYCLESHYVGALDIWSYDDPDVVKCPKCAAEFVAWIVTAPVMCSAKLPVTEPVKRASELPTTT